MQSIKSLPAYHRKSRSHERAAIPDALYTPSTASNCRGVYPVNGGLSWEVKVKLFGRIHRVGKKFSRPSEAIQALVQWYRERFGPHWEYAAKQRESNPWKIVRGSRGDTDGRYLLFVWLFGKPHQVDPPGAIGWGSKEAARQARPHVTERFIRQELARRGLSPAKATEFPVLWRYVGPEPPDPPAGSVWWATREVQTMRTDCRESSVYPRRTSPASEPITVTPGKASHYVPPQSPQRPKAAPLPSGLPDLEPALLELTRVINETAALLRSVDMPDHERALRLVADVRSHMQSWRERRRSAV